MTSNSSTLSPRQKELCEAVARLSRARGYPPSYRELAVEMDCHPTRIRQLVVGAVKRGAVAYDAGKMRSLRIVHRPA